MVTMAMGRIAAFCSYAHEDVGRLEELKAVLAPLREEAIIDEWSDPEIGAGEGWDEKIKQALNSAHLVLFIVTPDLLRSDYINSQEIPLSLARRNEGKCEVVPILAVNPQDDELWHANALAKLQPLPGVGRWLSDYPDLGAAYDAVRLGIREACKRIGGGDNPYRRSSVGDWRHALQRVEVPTGQSAKWEFTEEVVEKSETKAIVRIETSRSGQLEEKRIEIDLTKAINEQAQSLAGQAGMPTAMTAPMSIRAAADGTVVSEEFVTIGFKSYQTRVETVTTQSDLDGAIMDTLVRTWKSIDVPFDGTVRGTMEHSWPNGARGSHSTILLGFGFQNAATEKPKPKIHGPLPTDVAVALGLETVPSIDQAQGQQSSAAQEVTGADLFSKAFSWAKNRIGEEMKKQQPAGFPHPPPGPSIYPARWALQANDMQGNLMFDVMLFPNFLLQGVCWNNGVQSQLTGGWGFDPRAAVLRIDVNSATFGFPPSQYWVTFQITGSDSAAYLAHDMNGRPFRIWVIQ